MPMKLSQDHQALPHRQAGEIPPRGFRSGRHLRSRHREGRSQGDARRRRRAARRAAGEALRAGPLGGARRVPGDGCGRQGRRDQARDVRRQPARLPGAFLQGAEPRRSSITISSGASPRRCRSAAASASSIARTTRRCWSCACTRRFWRASGCRKARRQGHLGRSLQEHPRVRAPSRAQRRADPQVLPARLEGGAAPALPRAARGAGQALEIRDGRRRRAQALGQVHARLRGRRSAQTSRPEAPWYVVPADNKWFARLVDRRGDGRGDGRPRRSNSPRSRARR